MVLVLVTTKSDSELSKIAPVVASNLKADGYDYDGVCFIKADTFPIIIADGKMQQTATILIFVFGLDIENQGQSLRLAEKISAQTGYKTTIL